MQDLIMADDKPGKNVKKRYELVPPDGGWAYMIWIAMTINISATYMFIPSMGMILNDFYIMLGLRSMDIQVVNGINSMSLAIGSFATGPMTKVMSMRKLSFIGSACVSAGVFGIAFVKSYPMFVLTQGVLMGVGNGMVFNVSCTSLNNYFLEKRFMINSLAQTIAAAATMVAPLAVHWTAEHYGFRGTILFMAAVYMQTMVGSCLQQPVKWHLKRVPIKPDAEKLLGKDNCGVSTNENSVQVVDINIDQIAPEESSSVLAYIKNAIDWQFIKQFLRTCACVGVPLSLVSDVMFTLFVPQALYAHGWQEGEVAWVLTLMGFGDIATRVILIVASAWLKKVGNNVLFVIGMIVDIATKLGKYDVVVIMVFLWFPHPTVTYVTLTISGCSRCMLIVLFALVISDAAPPDKYATAFGVAVLIYGTIGITIGPAIGAVRDATGDYTVMFYLLIALMAAVTVAWFIEIYRDRHRNIFNKAL